MNPKTFFVAIAAFIVVSLWALYAAAAVGPPVTPIPSGGLGTSTAPAYGKLLVGGSHGEYEFTGTTTLGLKTTNVAEGSNLYFTTGRAQAATSASYPLLYANGVVSAAYGTTTANNWSAVQVFNGNASTSALTVTGLSWLGTILSGTWNGSTIGASYGGTGIGNPGAAGVLVGSYPGGGWQQVATSSLGLTTTNVAEGSNLYWTNARFDNRLAATTSLPNIVTLSSLVLPLSQTTGTLGVNQGGTASTSLGGILAGNGTGAIKSATIGSGLLWDGTTLANTGVTSNAGDWAGTWQTFAPSHFQTALGFTPVPNTRSVATTYPLQGGGALSGDLTLTTAFSTTTANAFNKLNTFANATSTLFSAGTIWDTGTPNAVLSTDQNGKVVGTSTIGVNLLSASTIGATSPNGTLTFGSAASLGSTFTGDLNLANPNAWTGVQTLNGGFISQASSTVTGTLTLATTTTGSLNGTIYVTGWPYTQTGAGIQIAINTACSNSSLTSGRVIIPNINITVAASITVPSNCWISGYGTSTILTLGNSVNGSIFKNADQTNGNNNIEIDHLKLVGNKGNNTTGSGVSFKRVTNGHVHDLDASMFFDQGVDIASDLSNTVSSQNIYIYNVNAYLNGRNGIFIGYGTYHWYVYSNTLTQNGTVSGEGSGLEAGDPLGNGQVPYRGAVFNNTCSNNNINGFQLTTQDTSYSGNVCDNNGDSGIHLNGTDGKRNTFSANVTNYNVGNGFRIRADVDQTTISAQESVGNIKAGLETEKDTGGNVKNISINGGNYTLNGLEGLKILQANNVSLDGVHADNNGTSTPSSGVNVTSSSNIRISNLFSNNNTLYAVSNSANNNLSIDGLVANGNTTGFVSDLTTAGLFFSTSTKWGIGVTNPSATLQVNGNLLLDASSGGGSSLTFTDSGSYGEGQTQNGKPLIFQRQGNNLGIGATTSPGSLLSLANIANFTASTSTFYGVGGLNITAGCFSIANSCLSLSSFGGTLGIQNGGTATTTMYPGGVLFYDSTLNTLSQAGNGNGFFYDRTNNRLGLGTTLPGALLDTYGVAATAGLGGASNYSAIYHFATGDNTGTVGPGIGFSTSNATTPDSVTASIVALRTGGSGQGALGFYTKSSTSNGVAPVLGLVINQNQLVGIGTTTPAAKLDVNGTFQIASSSVLSEIAKNDFLKYENSYTADGYSILEANAPAANPLEADFLANTNIASGGRWADYDEEDYPTESLTNITEGVSDGAAFNPFAIRFCNLNNGGACVGHSAYAMIAFANGTDAFGVNATSSVDQTASVQISSSTAPTILEVDTTPGTHIFSVKSSGASLFAGNVGIGTSTPWASLSLGANMSFAVTEASSTNTATQNVNWLNGNQQKVELTQNTTIQFGNNTVPGQTLRLILCQDNTGSRTVTWPTSSTQSSSTIIWAGHAAPTMTATANTCDVASFIVTGATGTPVVFGAATQDF